MGDSRSDPTQGHGTLPERAGREGRVAGRAAGLPTRRPLAFLMVPPRASAKGHRRLPRPLGLHPIRTEFAGLPIGPFYFLKYETNVLQIMAETLLSVSPARLPGLFVSIDGTHARLRPSAQAAVFKLSKHGSRKLPLLVLPYPSSESPSRDLVESSQCLLLMKRACGGGGDDGVNRVVRQCVCATRIWATSRAKAIKVDTSRPRHPYHLEPTFLFLFCIYNNLYFIQRFSIRALRPMSWSGCVSCG